LHIHHQYTPYNRDKLLPADNQTGKTHPNTGRDIVALRTYVTTLSAHNLNENPRSLAEIQS